MPKANGQGMTVTAYAKHRGCSRQAIYKALKEGRIVREDDGSIDQPKADAMWRANTGVASGREPDGAEPEASTVVDGTAASPSYAESRAKKEHYLAELARLRFQEEEASLVRVDDVARVWATLAATVRSKVLGVPMVLGFAAEVLACQSEHQVRALLALLSLALSACTVHQGRPTPAPQRGGACHVSVELPGSTLTLDLGIVSSAIVQAAALTALDALQDAGLAVPPTLSALASQAATAWGSEAGSRTSENETLEPVRSRSTPRQPEVAYRVDQDGSWLRTRVPDCWGRLSP